MQQYVLITGCSGGGKSSLVSALAARGYATVPEPGRRIVLAAQEGKGGALPWVDPEAFARRAVAMARADLADTACRSDVLFSDRGLIDAAVALRATAGISLETTLGPERAYGDVVFVAPPWPEIFVQDVARQHDFAAATTEYEQIRAALCQRGHNIVNLPQVSIAERVEFVLHRLGLPDHAMT